MERYTDGLRNVTPKKLQYASCALLPDKLDLNQHGAASRIVVPKGAEFTTRTRGIRNRIVLEGVEEDEDACHVIELNGFASELTVVGA